MTSYRKTLFLKDGNDILKLALEDTKTSLVYAGQQSDANAHKDFLIEGPGSTIVKGSSLKLEEDTGLNKLEVGGTDVKATVGTNSLTLDANGLKLKDSVWSGENIGNYARATQQDVTNVSTSTSACSASIYTVSTVVHTNADNWNTYRGALILNDWTATKIKDKFDTAGHNHENLSTHVADWLAVPKDGQSDQTLEDYVEGLVTTEAGKISGILENAPESLNTLNELKIALETTDYDLVNVQIRIVQKLNDLAKVVAQLTTEDPDTEFPTNDPSSHPLWYASITEPIADSVANQPEIDGQAEHEPPNSLVE
tara:strand:+ start:41 stop:973 length:933 start_codon:yes stop_codon:yes gene_type:complete